MLIQGVSTRNPFLVFFDTVMVQSLSPDVNGSGSGC
jgi:hypothetical protein